MEKYHRIEYHKNRFDFHLCNHQKCNLMTQNPSSTTECLVCGHQNRAGVLVCENCGSLLNAAAKTRQATRDLRGASHKIEDEHGHDVLGGEQVALKGNEYRDGMGLRLSLKESHSPLLVAPELLQAQVVIGRRDPITQQSPAVDLDQFAAYRMGVSRKHAALQVINGQLTVSDLGSSNGTYLNDRRLPMRQPQVIVAGDRLRLGQIELLVEFVEPR